MSSGATENNKKSHILQERVKQPSWVTPPNWVLSLLDDALVNDVIPCPAAFWPKASALQAYDLVVAFDTEYIQDHTVTNRNGVAVDANTILSYQYSATYRDSNGCQYCEGILYPPDGYRYSYVELLSVVLQRFNIGYGKAADLQILSLAHYGAAEWAAYRDRRAYIDFLIPIGGAPVTAKPMTLKLPFHNKHSADVQVTWRDTCLLTPGKGGLAKAAEVTQHKKQKLAAGEIEDMRALLKNDRQKFESYAINDCRVCLEYYGLFLEKFELLTGLTAEPLTIGDATVRAYLHHLKSQNIHPDDVFGLQDEEVINVKGRRTKKKVKTSVRAFSDVLAAQSFLGGLNMAYESRVNPKTEGFIFLDIDFSGAYPSALAALPVIDWSATPRKTSTPGLRVDKHQQHFLPISLHQVQFEFPQGSKHACLPMASPYGLLYTRKGMSITTGPELELARAMGAKITTHESKCFASKFEDDTKTKVQLAFAGYLSKLTNERAKHPKGSLENTLLKELANSFYGKLAQGLDDRSVRDLRGRSDKLHPSKITNGHYASLCTGIVRAALAAVVATAESFENVSVLSATTDGCMLRLPYSGAIQFDAKGNPIPPDLQRVHPDLYAALSALAPVKILQAGRQNMGLDPMGWLESKHIGDEAITIKTRGYLLRCAGKNTFLAKCGHQISSSEELESLFENPEIATVTMTSLTSIVDIATREQEDLVRVVSERRSNTDFDCKRVLLEDGSTTLHETVDDILRLRLLADEIRRHDIRATPAALACKDAGIQLRGGSEKAIKRQILCAIANNLGGWRPMGMTNVAIAVALCVPIADYKNARKAKFKALPATMPVQLEALMQAAAASLQMPLTDGMRRALTQK